MTTKLHRFLLLKDHIEFPFLNIFLTIQLQIHKHNSIVKGLFNMYFTYGNILQHTRLSLLQQNYYVLVRSLVVLLPRSPHGTGAPVVVGAMCQRHLRAHLHGRDCTRDFRFGFASGSRSGAQRRRVHTAGLHPSSIADAHARLAVRIVRVAVALDDVRLRLRGLVLRTYGVRPRRRRLRVHSYREERVVGRHRRSTRLLMCGHSPVRARLQRVLPPVEVRRARRLRRLHGTARGTNHTVA